MGVVVVVVVEVEEEEEARWLLPLVSGAVVVGAAEVEGIAAHSPCFLSSTLQN